MVEVRCEKCGKLLGYIKGEYQIKCARCGTMNAEGSVEDESKRPSFNAERA